MIQRLQSDPASGGTIPDLIWFQGGDEEFALTQQILAAKASAKAE